MPFRSFRVPFPALVLATFPLLAACGGGGGGGAPAAQTVVIPADDARTGTLQQSPDGSITPTPSDFAMAGQIALISGTGDPTDREFRGVITFPRTGVPAAANVLQATLTLHVTLASPSFVAGSGGSAVIGPGVVDHVDVGAILDGADFDSVALDEAFAVFVQPGQLSAASGDVLTIDVTDQVQADVAAGRDQIGFRLLFPAAILGGEGPFQIFADGSDPADFPSLSIQFQP